jgi:hypothetical protein
VQSDIYIKTAQAVSFGFYNRILYLSVSTSAF